MVAYVIRANNKSYEVLPHAARRMVQRYILEETVIAALEKGTVIEQPHGTDLYEYGYYDSDLEDVVIIRVVVDEFNLAIVSVIDDTDFDEEV